MAELYKAMLILAEVEHNNDNRKLLHKNDGENGLTFFGIYQSAHPKLRLWGIIERYLLIEKDINKCSVILANNKELMIEVEKFYKEHFWDKMKLDKVENQKVADELFIFGVNVNWPIAAKEVQKLLGFTGKSVDGFIGNETLKRLNTVDVAWFDKEFDKVEVAYYERIIAAKPHLAKNLPGWKNRAYKV